MSLILPSCHRLLFGRDHRADGEDPVPDELRDLSGRPCTARALWLGALLERFGRDEVASWGAVRVESSRSRSHAAVLVNADVRAWRARAVFTAVRDGPWWVLRRGHATAGRPLATCADLGEVEVLAAWSTPALPPPGSGWTFEEWRRGA